MKKEPLTLNQMIGGWNSYRSAKLIKHLTLLSHIASSNRNLNFKVIIGIWEDAAASVSGPNWLACDETSTAPPLTRTLKYKENLFLLEYKYPKRRKYELAP